MEIVMCVEWHLLDSVKQQHEDLLKTLMISYLPTIEAAQYNRVFDACFNLAEFICVAESTSEQYLNDDQIEFQSAQYVLQSISDLMDEKKDVESIEYQYIVQLIQYALTEEGRLKKAMKVMDDYFLSKYGMRDVISQTSIHTNFLKLKID
ncbi:MAG: hypothetical protein RLZZ66_672 [Pseudomonadota bacterium]|jgi:hypothetical protein